VLWLERGGGGRDNEQGSKVTKRLKAAIVTILVAVGVSVAMGGCSLSLRGIEGERIDTAATDMTRLLARDLPARASVIRTQRFLQSHAVTAFVHTHHLGPVAIEPLETAAEFAAGDPTPLTIPHGTVLPVFFDGESYTTALDVTFFFDARGHLAHYRVVPSQIAP